MLIESVGTKFQKWYSSSVSYSYSNLKVPGVGVHISAYFSTSCCIPSSKPFTKCIFKFTWYIFLNKSSTWFLKYASSLLPRVIPSLKPSGGLRVNCWRKTRIMWKLWPHFAIWKFLVRLINEILFASWNR